MIRVGVLGYGYWGPNLVRNFSEASGCSVSAVGEPRSDRRQLLRSRYPSIDTSSDCYELLADPRIDAIAIATPPSAHFDLALAGLRAGKHVWVEKPLAVTSDQAARLVDEADRLGRVLHVDHTFVYSGAVRKVRELVLDNQLGQVYYFDSVRVNLGPPRHDVNVLWDLAVHDLSIMDYVLPARPCAVSATGLAYVPGQPEDIAYLTLLFDTPLLAHIQVNWLATAKTRRTQIGGSRGMIVYDDLEPSEKVKLYDRPNGREGTIDQQRHALLVGYRAGDTWAPQVDPTEALRTEVEHFIGCIDRNERSLTDGRAGLRVVRILEAATRSMRERGRVVELEAEACSV